MDDRGHWYRRDGRPCYEIPNKTGGMRGINLQWDRHLQLVPSTTTVPKIIYKAQLEAWKQDRIALMAEVTPRAPGEDDKAFLGRVRNMAFQSVDEAADLGTGVHDACEMHYSGRPVPHQYRQHVAGVVAEIGRLFPDVTDWIPEQYFAHPLGFGGKVDLHSPSTGIVIDYKGKSGDFSDKKQLAYDQHWQLAPYRRGLKLPRAPGANIFFSRSHPGATTSRVWTPEEMDEGWRIFLATLELWKLLKKYDPSFVDK